MSLVELSHVSRHYPAGDMVVRAVDDVSLAIDEGEHVALVGPSGSGKTTLMALIGCLDRPTTGSIRIAGRDVSRLDREEQADMRRAFLGFVFQQFALLPRLDALANVALPLIYGGVSPAQARAQAAAMLGRLGLADRLHHRPAELSGGQQQRVAVARALVGGARLVLADEPTGALDTATSAGLLDLFAELHAQGTTLVVVTHDHEVAARAGRAIRLRDGRIEGQAA